MPWQTGTRLGKGAHAIITVTNSESFFAVGNRNVLITLVADFGAQQTTERSISIGLFEIFKLLFQPKKYKRAGILGMGVINEYKGKGISKAIALKLYEFHEGLGLKTGLSGERKQYGPQEILQNQ